MQTALIINDARSKVSRKRQETATVCTRQIIPARVRTVTCDLKCLLDLQEVY